MPAVFYIPSTTQFYVNEDGIQVFLDIALGTFVTTAIRTEVANYTVQIGDGTILVDASAGEVTITLLPVADADNYYNIKKIDTTVNRVIIETDAAETIDGDASVDITAAYESLQLITDGSNWFVI